MNYLAHALLSSNNEALLIGNFIADHLRGNKFDNLPPNIIEGVKMHRQIDAFTDTHELFKNSKRIFYTKHEKYSGVLIDIYFDHLLAKNFFELADIRLNTFAQKVYGVYNNNKHFLPKSSERFLSYVINNNIYEAYAEKDGITTVLGHLSQRINHVVQLQDSMADFIEHEKILEENFKLFFQEAQQRFR